MTSQYVICPETAHIETIELDPHPLGVLVLSCSRDQESCEGMCSRRCAEQIERRARCPRGGCEIEIIE